MTATLERNTLVVAHRGGAALNPENSLAAFKHALELGVLQIETDVHLSADNEPVLIHDPTLDRTTIATGAVRERPWADLQKIGLKNSSETIPHLRDILGLLRPTQTNLRLELKLDPTRTRYPRLAKIVHSHLHAAQMLERSTITSFDWRSLELFRELSPVQHCIGLIKRPRYLELGGLEGTLSEAQTFGLFEIALHISQYKAGDVRRAAQQGVQLGLYAVNTQAEIEVALKTGVAAFTTDRPDLALLEQQRRR